MAMSHPNQVRIDLSALRHNFRLAKRAFSGRPLLAVVKADAYGHGAEQVARALHDEGAEMFGVAHLREAESLRRLGLVQPILLFCGADPGDAGVLADLGLVPMLFDLELARALDAAGRARGRRIPVHLKIDTGMGRVGFRPEELDQVLAALAALRHVAIEGVVSHLAMADEREHPWSDRQYDTFAACLERVRQAGFQPRWVHLSNSAGLFGREFPLCNLARPGISLYGGLPGEGFRHLDLKPVMSFVSRVAQVKKVPAGTGISYGHRFVTRQESLLAAIPVGYSDGYLRALTNRAQVLIRGRRVPLVGRVCMNWILADVGALPRVAVGDPVTLLGTDGSECIRGDELAGWADTIDYEIFCLLGSCNPRCYLGR
ncbi:alanine racemase [Geothermobacter ehrlichii]|uniref:Alanine racemase n=1 Tax=Geothermobacter ehrlichii TaxID=213224 RepID=A0A5D3WFZ3_9BACT|nr:alanine racemase [Geothermobacter ehrlichii]TYO97078.1 alanine racemase [Geothermobacter ehrlichii]